MHVLFSEGFCMKYNAPPSSLSPLLILRLWRGRGGGGRGPAQARPDSKAPPINSPVGFAPASPPLALRAQTLPTPPLCRGTTCAPAAAPPLTGDPLTLQQTKKTVNNQRTREWRFGVFGRACVRVPGSKHAVGEVRRSAASGPPL